MTARRDCGHCHKFMYHETGDYRGQPVRGPSGNLHQRPRGTRPPCYHKKPDGTSQCAKGRPFRTDLYTSNLLAYRHFRECRAVRSFPDDPIVRKNAAILDSLE